MKEKKDKVYGGFTIVELVIAAVISVIVAIVVGAVVADSQRGWNKMYTRTYAQTVTGSYVARKTFDAVIRSASRETYTLDTAGRWIEVYYYADQSSATVDRYVRLYKADKQLKIERGKLNPRQTLRTDTVCDNVYDCIFQTLGRSVQMVLTLDDGSSRFSCVSSAVMQNE